ncbi:MAG: hypothetical protein O7D91_08125 [Planctomycetota bacterium]|nr:hypothetical protein [Planctomycetota bacterium]
MASDVSPYPTRATEFLGGTLTRDNLNAQLGLFQIASGAFENDIIRLFNGNYGHANMARSRNVESRMPPAEALLETIRKGLIGSLTDFVHDSGFGLTDLNIVVDLVYQLAEYREEGVLFFPDVYLVKPTDALDPLSMIAPGADRLNLKNANLDSEFSARVLKDCAALANHGWSVFVEVSGNEGRYGLFRSEQLPVSVSSAELLADPDTASGTVMLIRNCSKNCVELISGAGRSMEFALTSSKPASEPVAHSLSVLAAAAVSALEEPMKSQIRPYIERTLSSVCQQCHGTIIAVLSAETGPIPNSLTDGVVLEVPVDLADAFSGLSEEESASALSRLSARETLVRGMIQSDGITILGSDGTVRAFSVFVKPNDEERGSMDEMDIKGGARSRAYQLLKLRLGDTLDCVFFRSQDGKMECTVKA